MRWTHLLILHDCGAKALALPLVESKAVLASHTAQMRVVEVMSGSETLISTIHC